MQLFQQTIDSPILIWIAVNCAATVHLYWAAVRLPVAFSGREIYLAAIGVGYLFDLLWWRLVHVVFTCVGIQQTFVSATHQLVPLICNTGLPPLADYLLSYDLTLEVYLAGVFIGVVVFHSRCYGNGFARLGSTGVVYSMGIVFPAIIALIGWNEKIQTLSGYSLHWLTGFMAGVARSAIVHVLICERLPLWWQLSKSQTRFLMQDTIIVNCRWCTDTFGPKAIACMVHTSQRQRIRFGKLS